MIGRWIGDKSGVELPFRLGRWHRLAERIVARSEDFRSLSPDGLLRRGSELRWEARSGIPARKLLTEAFALLREASRRVRGQSHYAVQIMGGIALCQGGIAEMQTGEGKTLTALLPAFLHALGGRGCHVFTANDYLAERDADFARPILESVGLSVDCVLKGRTGHQRRAAYTCDVTYGTVREIGFDFLRDRLKPGGEGDSHHRARHGLLGGHQETPVQRALQFALIDEADSILIDEARTPLLISVADRADPTTASLSRWSRRAVTRLEQNIDFVFEPRGRTAWLTDAGCRKTLALPRPQAVTAVAYERIFKQVERALVAEYGYAADRDYIVAQGKVIIVDESTGRVMEGRKWQDGLQQAIETKEGLSTSAAHNTAARITVQRFFKQYSLVAGLTGTARHQRGELKRAYGLRVVSLPTRRRCLRIGLPVRVFTTMQAKLAAVANEIERLRGTGRAVLVGTPSVGASEAISRVLQDRDVAHGVLNCRSHAQEADIVAQAGEAGRVTVATNMAGRGTDIVVSQEVRRAGGLHVIATEMHSSARIDRQLVGRTARQGDPGTFQFFLSLEDELLRSLLPETVARARRRARPGTQGELSRRWVAFFRQTQRRLERLHRKERGDLLRSEKERDGSLHEMGLDPCVEFVET